MSKAHALIIDDNVKNVNVLANLLADENVSFTRVSDVNRLEAVVADLSAVNVVFLDLEMPGLDGYQVLEWLKSLDQFAGVPVIAYTVHISEIHHANQLGFDGFIGKPLDPDRFPAQLERILSGGQVWETV